MTQPLQDQEIAHVNGHSDHDSSKDPSKEPDSDAQALVIESLRSQIQDLFSQVSQLNNKLVKSYDRVSDLEDQIHEASNNMRSSSIKISQLELERTQHMSALNSGLLVERTHVTAELTRLMEKATEEAARRGQAESARAEIEKDLDDLSAGLFGQANSMVAEARLGRAASERKVEETERALKGAEEAIAAMQVHMQALDTEKEESKRQLEDIRVTMGKGKWVQRAAHPDLESSKRLISSHAQYRDFLYFVSHLREQRQKSVQIPTMSMLLNHSFTSRLQTEDSDPTIRLDLAPSLNWLTRKSVISAIHQGQLDIEPLPSGTLIQELSSAQSMIPGLNTGSNISCALCGTFILSDPSSHSIAKPPSHPHSRYANGTSYSNWSSSLLKNPLVNSITSSVMNTPSHSPTQTSPPPSHVYIFRLAADTTRMIQSQTQTRNPSTIYPLCSSGWCLTRLRAACSLWAFVRTGVVEKVWEESPIVSPSPARKQIGPPEPEKQNVESDAKPPRLPHQRSRIGIFWERAASLGKGDTDRTSKETEKVKNPEDDPPKRSPSPPPQHTAPEPKIAAPPLPIRNRGRAPTGGEETEVSPPGEATPQKLAGVNPKTPALGGEKTSSVTALNPTPSKDSFPSVPQSTSKALYPATVLRPQSPSAVPLPESAPGTPAFPPTNSENKIGLPGVPSGFELPRTSSPTPPPLPRRARTRPLSTVIHQPTASLIHSPGNLAQQPRTEKVVEVSKPSEKPVPVIEESAQDKATKPAQTDERVQSEQLGVPAISDETARPIVNGHQNPTSVEPEVQEVSVNGIAISVINDQDLVGDNSWEERTWKELVRLREDMFWARIGGLR